MNTESVVKARNKWHFRLDITKQFPDGHQEKGVATLYPERGTELNPVFFVDGEYYYWGEKMRPGCTGTYHPSVKRTGYGHMTAEVMTKAERYEAMITEPRKRAVSRAGGSPGRGKVAYPPMMGQSPERIETGKAFEEPTQ